MTIKRTNKKNKLLAILFILFVSFAIVVATYLIQNPKEIADKFASTLPTPYPSPILTRKGTKFLLNNTPVSMFGLRTANALESDAVTQKLIKNLGKMKSYSIQSINVSLQGSRISIRDYSNSNAFMPDGAMKDEYKIRLANILNEAAKKNIVVVITYYHQAHEDEFESDLAVIKAAENATRFLLPWRNIWLYTINEDQAKGWDLYNSFKTVEGRQKLYDKIKAIDPNRVVYISQESNDGFKAHTGETTKDGDVITEYSRSKNSDSYDLPGVITEENRYKTITDAETTYNQKGYWFYHAAWHQTVVQDQNGKYIFPRFDPGGIGTADDPGTIFIWNEMKRLSSPIRNPIFRVPPISTP